MNERGKPLKITFNKNHVKPFKMHKAAKSPNILNKTLMPSHGVNPKLKPKKLCPKGGDVCYCNPKH